MSDHYAGDPDSMPGAGGDDGQYLRKPWPHLTKVKNWYQQVTEVNVVSRLS